MFCSLHHAVYIHGSSHEEREQTFRIAWIRVDSSSVSVAKVSFSRLRSRFRVKSGRGPDSRGSPSPARLSCARRPGSPRPSPGPAAPVRQLRLSALRPPFKSLAQSTWAKTVVDAGLGTPARAPAASRAVRIRVVGFVVLIWLSHGRGAAYLRLRLRLPRLESARLAEARARPARAVTRPPTNLTGKIRVIFGPDAGRPQPPLRQGRRGVAR